MNIRILTANDVRSAIDMKAAITAMKDAFGQLSRGLARVPVRLGVESDAGVTLFMPAYLESTGDLGAKVASLYMGNPAKGLPAISAVVLVIDSATGSLRALLDGTYLTALRTGAAAGLATDLLARSDASVVTIFGAGAQAPAQIEAVRAVRPIEEVRIVSRTRKSAERFAEHLSGVKARVFEDRSKAVRGAHIITAVTTSEAPVFVGKDVEPGTHINGVGSFTPTMQEVDADTVRRSRIVVDSREAVLEEAGDLIIPINDGVIRAEDLDTELGDIVNGRKPGRTADDEITFFKSVGVAVQDVVTARHVIDAAESRGLGASVEI